MEGYKTTVFYFCKSRYFIFASPELTGKKIYATLIQTAKRNDEESTHGMLLQRIFRYGALVRVPPWKLRGRKRGNGEHGFRAVHRAAESIFDTSVIKCISAVRLQQVRLL